MSAKDTESGTASERKLPDDHVLIQMGFLQAAHVEELLGPLNDSWPEQQGLPYVEGIDGRKIFHKSLVEKWYFDRIQEVEAASSDKKSVADLEHNTQDALILTREELANHLKCSVSTIDRKRRDGSIPSIGAGRFDLNAVLVALRKKADAVREPQPVKPKA